jgi:hypothetical protein
MICVTVAVLNGVSGEQPDGGIIGNSAYVQVDSADQDFIVAVGEDHSVWQFLRQHRRGSSAVTAPACANSCLAVARTPSFVAPTGLCC